MEHFFVVPSAIEENNAVITGEDAAHIARVLRMRPGDEIHIADGQNNEYRARLVEVDKQSVRTELLGRCATTAEPMHHFTLYQGLPKSGKMEVIIQKCVELGVSHITPVLTERSVVRPDGDFEKKRLRYQRIAYEAAKQSGRAVIPQVTGLISLAEINYAAHGMLLHAYEEEHGVSLRQALRKSIPPKDIALFIGPEGGFEEDEAALLARSGAVAVSLGPRILRTETAGMAMLAMLIYELEG